MIVRSLTLCSLVIAATTPLIGACTPTVRVEVAPINIYARLDADVAEHRLVGRLALDGREHDADVAAAEQRHRAEVHPEAVEHRAGAGEATVGDLLDDEIGDERST